MKLLLIFGMLLSLNFAFAQKKADVERMLEQMEKMGTFTPEQIKAAKDRLKNMDESTFNGMVKKAHSAAQDPKMQEQAKKMINKYKEEGGKIPEQGPPAKTGN